MTPAHASRDTVPDVDAKTTTWERLRRVDPRIGDGILAAAILAFAQLDLWRAREPGAAAQPDLLAAAFLLVACAALYWRRTQPIAAAISAAAAVAAFGVSQHPATEPILPLMVFAYSLAAYRERSFAQAMGIVATLCAAAVSQADPHANWVELASNAFFSVGVPVVVGRIVWNRRRRIERERDLAARDAVALERGRIARELHDVVAHSLSVMVVQAGAARAILRRDPDGAESALRSIEGAGRTGLTEMRRLLSADGEVAPALAPQPGLDQLGELLARMRATGLDVELVVEGDARAVDASIDLSAYRIVQEGLTNTMRHAGDGAHARVLLRYDDDAIEVEVTDDGLGPSPGADGSGRGLLGMRERVAFMGGEIRTAARPGGGFVVHARIPVDARGASQR
jgi:signal transduction histidine kinase